MVAASATCGDKVATSADTAIMENFGTRYISTPICLVEIKICTASLKKLTLRNSRSNHLGDFTYLDGSKNLAESVPF
jgi:hypothetical protein